MSSGSIVPRPPLEPRPDYLPERRAGTRYVRPDCLPPLETRVTAASGLSMRTKPGSVSSAWSRPVTSHNPARHTAKSRARAVFLEGERAKFDEMFPPLGKDAPASVSVGGKPVDQFKELNFSHEPSEQTLFSDDNKEGERCTTKTSSPMRPHSPSYSEVTSGMFKHYTQPAASQENNRFPERPQQAVGQQQQQQHPEMDQQSHADTAQEWSYPAMVQHQSCPGTVQHQRSPEVVQQHPRPSWTVQHQRSPEVVQQQPRLPGTVQHQHSPEVVQQQPRLPGTVQHQRSPEVVQQPRPPPVQRQPSSVPVQYRHCSLPVQQQPFPLQLPCPIPMQPHLYHVPVQQQFCPVLVPLHHCIGPLKKQRYPQEDFATLLARRKEEYARNRAEKEKYAELVEQMRKLVAEHEAFMAQYPDQLAKMKLKKSVDVDEAKRARNAGDIRREFDVYKAHLQDLFYNKAELMTLLNKEKKEQENVEEKIRAEIEEMKNNDEIIIERKVQLLHGMLNEECSSDDESDEEEYDDDDEESSEEVYKEEGKLMTDKEQEAFGTDEIPSDNEECTDDEAQWTHISSENRGVLSTIPHPPVCCCQHNTCQSDGQQKADLVSSAATIPSKEEVLKDLDNLASEVEEDVLEQLAKFGRLLQLETVHSGRDNSEMVGLLDSLHAVIEGEHEARRDKEEEKSSQTPNWSDKQADLVVDNRPGVDENTEEGVVDEEEEECSPILPAFTSTSINTNCVESKATFEELRNKSSSPIQPSRSESDVPSCPQEETDDQARAREDSKSGKKQVSFVTEEGVKHHGSNITFYANMSVNDLAELVSSALVSDLAPYASENKACGSTDKSPDADSGSDPSVIAVKYVSVMTTEKNKTILRPVFAKKHGSKLNTLAFTITGEILLSSQTNDSRESSSHNESLVADDLGTAHRVTCPTVPSEALDRGGEKPSTASLATDKTETSSEAAEENEGVEGTGISERSVESQSATFVDNGLSVEDYSVEETSALVSTDTELLLNAPTTALEYGEQSTLPAKACVESKSETRNAGEVDRGIEQNSSAQTNTETSATIAETVEEQSNEDSSAQIETDTGAVERAEAERAEKQTNGNGDTTDSEAESEGDLAAHRSVPIESNGLCIEFDVAAMCSAMCRAIPQVLNQLAIETATHSLTLDRATFMQTEVTQSEQQKSSSKEMENAHPGQGQGHEGSATHLEAATPSSDSTPEEKKEEAPAPYVYRLFTPSSFNTTPELMTTPPKCRNSTKCNASDCTVNTCAGDTKPSVEESDNRALVPFDSHIITLKAFEGLAKDVGVLAKSSDTETKSDGGNTIETHYAEITENPLVPFDPQIITIKAFKTSPLATPSTGAAAERQDETAFTEQNTGKASVPLLSQAGTDTSTTHDDREMAKEEKALVPFDSQIVTLKVLKTTTKDLVPNGNTASQENGGVEAAHVAEPTITVNTSTDVGVDDYGEEKALVPFDSQIVTLKVLKTTTEDLVPNGNTASQENGGVEAACVAEPTIEPNQVNTSTDVGVDDCGPTTETDDQVPAIKAMEECRADSCVPTDTSGHKEATSGSDKETAESRMHKSLPSFRTTDLEKAVNPQYGHVEDEKFKLRCTKSRPVIPLMEPLPMLLPRRPKLNPKLYQTPKHVGTRSGPLKAETMKQLSRQSITNREKTETVEQSNSRVKSSKSFRSHSSLVTADGNQLQQSYQTAADQQNKQLESTSASKNGQEENRSHHSRLLSDVTSERPVKLSRPKSLPATIREAGVRFTQQMRKVQSEKTSTVPKLPKL